MREAIAVATYRGSPWLERCINSIPSDYPVIVVRAGPYECGALLWAMENTTLDRWLFLQDSTEILDPSWIGDHWGQDTSVGLLWEPSAYGSYLGWWKRSVLERIALPATPDKISAVLAEMSVPQAYTAIEPVHTLWPELTINTARPVLMFEGTPHERTAMLYENEYFRKWKSSYCGGTAEDAQERDDRIRKLYP